MSIKCLCDVTEARFPAKTPPMLAGSSLFSVKQSANFVPNFDDHSTIPWKLSTFSKNRKQ